MIAPQTCRDAYALGASYKGQPRRVVSHQDAVLALTEYDIADRDNWKLRPPALSATLVGALEIRVAPTRGRLG